MILEEYLTIINRKIKAGIQVFLCPACMETVIVAKMLINEYHIKPTGFCDNDIRKKGKNINSIVGLKILSFDDAVKEKEAVFFVVSPHNSAEIIGKLVNELNVSKERIINYQPVEKREICHLICQDFFISNKVFSFCCMKNHPTYNHNLLSLNETISSLYNLRNNIINYVEPIPDNCSNCYNTKSRYIYKSRKLTSVNFSFVGWCNYKCQYCSAHRPELKNYKSGFVLEEYLIEMEKRGMLNDIFSVLYAVGEPTLNEKRFSLYEYCGERKYFMDVFSNCSVFDQSLFDLAHKSPVIIRKSFDAGTPETYAKIKGVNCYYKMLDNVRCYLEAPFLALNPKYLFVPGVNDNETDINGFVKMCEQMKVDFVTPVFSIMGDEFEQSEHAQKMFKLLVDELAKRNIFTAGIDNLFDKTENNLYTKSFGNTVR